jgi:hypothetical protein
MVESRTERNQSRLIELFVVGFPPSAITNTPHKCSPFVYSKKFDRAARYRLGSCRPLGIGTSWPSHRLFFTGPSI